MRQLTTILLLAWVLPGCGDDGGGGGSLNATLAPVYQTTGTWDLSGPLGDGYTVGDVVVDLLVDEVVERAVPSAFKDRARGAIDARVRVPIRTYVNQRTPMDLAPGGDSYTALAMTLAAVQVSTTLSLTGSSALSGTERIDAIQVPVGDDVIEVPLDALALDGEGAVVVESAVTGRVLGSRSLRLDPHRFEIRYGQLVSWLVETTLGVDLAAQSEALDAAVDCAGIAEDLVGDGLAVEIAGQRITITASPIASA